MLLMTSPITERPKPLTLEQQVTAYQKCPTVEARNQIIEQSMPMIRAQAGKLSARADYHGGFDRKDFVSMGVFGVMQAIETFDETQGLKFASFASIRVRGSIIDALRDASFVPRLEYARVKAIEELRAKLGRVPTWAEVHKRTGYAERGELKQPVESVRIRKTKSINRLAHSFDPACIGRRTIEFGDLLEDRNASADIARVDDKDEFDQRVSCLRLELRNIVTLYYREDLSMKEIGRSLGVSESRVSQLHKQAILVLRANIKAEAA